MSKIQQNDRTPFWGGKMHPEFKYLQLIVNKKNSQVNLQRNCFRELLKSIFILKVYYYLKITFILILNNFTF